MCLVRQLDCLYGSDVKDTFVFSENTVLLTVKTYVKHEYEPLDLLLWLLWCFFRGQNLDEREYPTGCITRSRSG